MFDIKFQARSDEIFSYRLNNLKNISSVTRVKRNEFSDADSESENRKNKSLFLDNLSSLLKKNLKKDGFEAFR